MKPTNRKLFILRDDAPLTANSPPPLTPVASSSVSMNSSLVLVILVLCTALLSAAFFCFFALCFRHQNSSSSPASACKAADPTDVVRSLPVRSYGGGAAHWMSKDCAVCLGEFGEGDDVKVMPFCGHVFHPVCIDTWLSSHVWCPVCRRSVS
ncbi:RING-H2 finger protein ATL57 [Morus notabilis]|uniref:RING-type E3 ubiquitin transferase n=1 Tax=Morus notabilis TaxID=981085 RepID=W9SBT5_9ROSA|nr:RING-H2 finger protein ATL57 [Morus notabilis]EXC24903.1 RING-H2 finger protein ATL57 [Morus notabilis]